MCVQDPHKDMRLKGIQAIEAYMPSWVKEKGVRVWGFKGEEDNAQEDEKSKYLVNKCLPCHADKSSWYKKLSLVIALFLVQEPYLKNKKIF